VNPTLHCTSHIRAGVFFKIANLDSLPASVNQYLASAFPAPVVSLSLYRDADLDGYHGDIGQLEFSVTEEAGEILCSEFLENDATISAGLNCFCGECERNNIPLATTSRSDQIHLRELLMQLGLE
jgi:hypothetical protein